MNAINGQVVKRMLIMLIILGLLFGGIFGYKAFSNRMFQKYMASQKQVVTISAMNVGYSSWQPQIIASGSVRAVRGVNVTSEVGGMVQTIYFIPGAIVTEGTVLVQLNADSDIALLHSLQASAELAKITYDRDQKQYAVHAISQATLDADAANLKNLIAQVDQQMAIVNKKTIRAPFSGRLGISAVNPGQYINPGDKMVALQQLDPVYVDFLVPQQQLVQLKTDIPISFSVDAYPGKIFSGKITTIDPLLDQNTRNAEIEATVANPNYDLVPGMFTSINVLTGMPERYLTLPQTAISFNPYGEIVYIIQSTNKTQDGNPVLTVTQSFVTTGEIRGDQVAILKGLKEGDRVVTSGQLKLKNGSTVIIK